MSPTRRQSLILGSVSVVLLEGYVGATEQHDDAGLIQSRVATVNQGGAKESGELPLLERPSFTQLEEDNAKCMDGSQAGFFFATSSAQDGEDNWVIHLQGGGECATQRECNSASENLKSSKNWYDKYNTTSSAFKMLNSLDCNNNPKLCSWNHVFLPYCSQDLWSGTANAPTDFSFGYIFAGHNILNSAVSYLVNHQSLKAAKTIIISGDSAGGMGVFINSGWLQDMLPRVKVVAAPIAGFYAPSQQYTGRYKNYFQSTDFSLENLQSLYNTWSSFVPKNCSAASKESPWNCLVSVFSAKYSTVPTFVTSAQTDSIQLAYHDGTSMMHKYFSKEPQISFLQQWHQNQSLQFLDTLKATDGWFNPACFMHTEFSNDLPLVQNNSFVQAFDTWFFGSKVVRIQDDCGVMCNNDCPKPLYGIVWDDFPN